MGSNFHNAFNDLVATLLQLYLYTFLLRIILQAVGADFYNPISQLIARVTTPLVRPLQAVLPRWPRFDPAAGIVMFLLTMLYVWVMALLWNQRVGVDGVVLYAALKIVALVLNLYLFGLVIQAILSWLGPGMNNPAGNLLWVMNEPLLKPIRRVIPPQAGLDFSPLVLIFVLVFVRQLIPLPAFF
jgi:YggT family protein